MCVIRMDKSAGANPMEALRIIAEVPRAAPKILIAVDDDVDPRDLDSVSWAMSYRMQPHRSVEIREILVSTGLDFSLIPPEARDEAKAMKGSAILIDATRVTWP